MSPLSGSDCSTLSCAILYTAAYADVFDYPLTVQELHRYLTGVKAPFEDLSEFLAHHSLLRQAEGYYVLPGREGLVNIRRKREQAAAVHWRQASLYGRIIACLPFIRMVAVTGSLAMNNVDGQADIDFMIVTAEGHLWTSRAFVLGIARLAAMHGVRLCPNYLISERALLLSDQSLYAAHELAQMVPLYGMASYNRLRDLNRWTERFLPNSNGVPPIGVPPIQNRAKGLEREPRIQSMLQAVLRTPPGTWFERWEMDRKIRRLTREQAGSPESAFSADQCKGHLHRHGQRMEQVLRNRLESLPLEY